MKSVFKEVWWDRDVGVRKLIGDEYGLQTSSFCSGEILGVRQDIFFSLSPAAKEYMYELNEG